MSQKFKVASAVAGVLASSLASNTTHGLTLSTVQALNMSGSATAGPSPIPASTSNTSTFTSAPAAIASTLGFAKFNASTGVLKNVIVSLTGASGTGTATRNVTVSGSGLGATGTAPSRTIVGGATMGAINFTANAVTAGSFGGNALRTTAGQVAPTTAVGTWSYTNASATVGSGNMTPSGTQTLGPLTTAQENSFIGASGDVDVISNMSFQAITKKNTSATNDFNQSTATSTVSVTGGVRLTYDYLTHAEASFTDTGPTVKSTTLNFGTVLVDSAGFPASQNLSVYNYLNAPTPGDQNSLNVVSVSNPISDATLTLNDGGSLNNNLTADTGNFQAFEGSFDASPANLGEHLAEFRVWTADTGYDDPNANSSYNGVSEQLTVVMMGSVKDHAAPSFSSTDPTKLTLNIDFNVQNSGQPYQNQETVSENFSVYNLLNGLLATQRVDLRFLGCSASSGDTASFDIAICGATPFEIAAGNSYSSVAQFFAPGRGRKSASYQLHFVDYAPNLTGTPSEFYLTLNVTGVPEPETLALLGAGLLAFGIRRKGSRKP